MKKLTNILPLLIAIFMCLSPVKSKADFAQINSWQELFKYGGTVPNVYDEIWQYDSWSISPGYMGVAMFYVEVKFVNASLGNAVVYDTIFLNQLFLTGTGTNVGIIDQAYPDTRPSTDGSGFLYNAYNDYNQNGWDWLDDHINVKWRYEFEVQNSDGTWHIDYGTWGVLYSWTDNDEYQWVLKVY